MSSRGPNPPDLAERIERLVVRGAQVVDALRGAPPGVRELQQAHRTAEQRRRRAAARHQRRRRTALGTAVVAGACGALGVLSAVVAGPAAGAFWLALAGLGAGLSALTFARLHRSDTPDLGPRSVPPPPSLPRNAIGAPEVARLVGVRVQLVQVAGSLEHLQPDAARELRAADAEAAVPLTLLAERLVVLNRIAMQLPTSPAAAAARESAGIVAGRLGQGCDTYEDLLAASARLLAAPDAARSTVEVLGPALDAMIAYAHGLQRAAEVMGPSAG